MRYPKIVIWGLWVSPVNGARLELPKWNFGNHLVVKPKYWFNQMSQARVKFTCQSVPLDAPSFVGPLKPVRRWATTTRVTNVGNFKA